jgi:hypothetical protein
MARRAHYSQERRQRDLAKAAKREAKREARAAKKPGVQPEEPATPDGDDHPSVVRVPARPSADSAADSGE